MTRERINQIGVSVGPVIRLFPVDHMRIETTIGSAKKLAALQRINLGKGP